MNFLVIFSAVRLHRVTFPQSMSDESEVFMIKVCILKDMQLFVTVLWQIEPSLSFCTFQPELQSPNFTTWCSVCWYSDPEHEPGNRPTERKQQMNDRSLRLSPKTSPGQQIIFRVCHGGGDLHKASLAQPPSPTVPSSRRLCSEEIYAGSQLDLLFLWPMDWTFSRRRGKVTETCFSLYTNVSFIFWRYQKLFTICSDL